MSDNKPRRVHGGRQRLDRISHHFLSEPQADKPRDGESRDNPRGGESRDKPRGGKSRPVVGESPSLLLLIDDSQTSAFPTLQLAAQLAGQGLECAVDQAGQTAVTVRARTGETIGNEAGSAVTQAADMTLHIHTGHRIGNVVPASPYMLLLPTEASPQGIRQSFLLLKEHFQQSMPPLVGITITGTDNPAMARQYFLSLQTAYLRFLNRNKDWHLRSYGFVYNQHPFPGLTGIVRLLLDDCINHLHNWSVRGQDSRRLDDSQPMRTSHDD